MRALRALNRRFARSGAAVLLLALLAATFAVPTASAVDTVPPITPEQHISRADFVRNMKQRVYGVRAPIKAIKAAVGNAPKAAQNAAIRRHIAGSTTKKKIVIPTLTKAESTAIKFGQVTSGAGEAVAKASWAWLALDLSYTGTAAAVEGLGGADSNGLFCDVSRLVNAGSTCHIGAAPSYTPNEGFLELVEGWDGGRNSYNWDTGAWSGSVRFDVKPWQYGVASSTELTVTMNVCAASSYKGPGPIGYWQYYPAGGRSSLRSTNLSTLSVPAGGCSSLTHVFPIDIPAGTGAASIASISPFWQGQVGYESNPGGTMFYRPQGAPGRDPGVTPNPARWWQVNWTCTTPDGGTTPGLANSAQWHEADPEWPSPPQPSCSSGTLTYARAVQMTNGVESGVLYEWDTPAEVGTEITTEVGKRPECADASCVVELIKVDSVTGTELACFDNPDLCVDWMKDPNKVDNYRCEYGGQAVDLSDCYVYGPIFDHTTITDTHTPFGDLVTGDPLPRPVPVPPSVPPTIPEDNSCPPPFSWTSLVNPWWYYKGTVCALQETFVPKNSTAHIQRITTAAAATTPALWVDATSTMFDGIAAGAGDCRGPGMHWGVFDRDVYPLNACADPGKKIAAWSRILTGVALVVLGSMACVRAVGSGFGWKPSAGGDS